MWSDKISMRNVLNKVINDKVFKILMERFGKYLIKIDLSCHYGFCDNQVSPDFIRCIVQFCPKLQALNLGRIFEIKYQNNIPQCNFLTGDECTCEPRLTKIIKIFKGGKIISKLKEFSIRAYHVDIDNLSSLISKMKNLESLHIRFETYDEDYALDTSGFPFSTLKEIIFENCRTLEDWFLIEIIDSIQNICSLVLIDLRDFNFLHSLMPSQYETLKNLHLQLYNSDQAIFYQDMTLFESFINLEKLNLYWNRSLVTDEFLEIISQHCRNLILLDINGNNEVTDIGIEHIASLPKLQCLFISNLDEISGKALNEINNLTVLDCCFCHNIEEENLCAIIRHSKLRVLNIEYCKKITNTFFDAAIEEVNTRKEKIDLTLIVTEDRLHIYKEEYVSPLLRIVGRTDCENIDLYNVFGYFPKELY